MPNDAPARLPHGSGPSPWVRGLVAGLAGGVAWVALGAVFFGPAQSVLSDPDRQSAKLLAAFAGPPAPRISETPWLLGAGVLGIGVIWGWVYVSLAAAWSGPWWRRGLRFGVVGWLLMVPWFEFYLPWNVLREPTVLVGLELVCWAGTVLGVGIVIAGVEAALARRRPAPVPATR